MSLKRSSKNDIKEAISDISWGVCAAGTATLLFMSLRQVPSQLRCVTIPLDVAAISFVAYELGLFKETTTCKLIGNKVADMLVGESPDPH